MSAQNNNPETKPTPGWVTYLFFVTVLFGVGATIYQVGFSQKDRNSLIREAMGTQIVKATIDIIPVRNAEAIANGEKTFHSRGTCFACHGKELQGGIGPNLKDAEWYHPPAKETHLFKIITNGIPVDQSVSGTPMAPKGGSKISSVEVWEIVYFLSSKNPSIEKDAVSNVE